MTDHEREEPRINRGITMERLFKAALFCMAVAVLGMVCYAVAWPVAGKDSARHFRGDRDIVDESRVDAVSDSAKVGTGENVASQSPGAGSRNGKPRVMVQQAGESPGSYTKLGHGGAELPETADHIDDGGPWLMTRDNKTGMIWEVKSALPGLRFKGNTYTWYDPDPDSNGGQSGTQNGGCCDGSSCDTGSFLQAINEMEFGGFSDWRLPNVRELGSLVNSETYNPSIDTAWFPNTVPNGYWTSTTYVLDKDLAWVVPFYHGLVNYYGNKSRCFHVRAVRKDTGEAVAYMIPNK